MDFNLNDEKKGELMNRGRQFTKNYLKMVILITKNRALKKKPDFSFYFFSLQ